MKPKAQLIHRQIIHLVDKHGVNQVGPKADVHLTQVKEVTNVVLLK